MKKLSIIFILIFGLACIVTANQPDTGMVELTSKDGRTMRATIDNYLPQTKELSVRVNGQGSVIRFSSELLDAASVKTVDAWFKEYAVVRLLRVEINRVPGADDTAYYSIEIINSSNAPIEGLRAEYDIPMKRRETVEKENKQASGSGTNNKKKKIQYETIEQHTVVSGEIDIPLIPARGELEIQSELFEIRSEQTLNDEGQGSGKTVTNSHSIQGILLRIYSGKTLLKTEESKHGLDQIVEKYRNN